MQVAGKADGKNGKRPQPSVKTEASRTPTAAFRRPVAEPFQPRRGVDPAFAPADEETEAFLRSSGRRRVKRGLIPQSRPGRIVAGVTTVVCLLAACGGTVLAARFATTDPHFIVPSSRAIDVDGNTHVTRSQMLSVFGEDIDRNIFSVPLEQRRAQLEQMPWVEHATVMRLLPNRIRVRVVERVPVAFVREGGRIGLVDANGVLLDIPPDTPGTAGYTFPVITGLKASETADERAEQMRLYGAFLKDLDSDGKSTSSQLSEIDVSDPEDARALIPDHNAEVLVHFGKENFLARYKRFQDHIAEWRAQYPRLSTVDMRYEWQVVLQMPPKDATVTSAAVDKVSGGTAAPQQVAPANRMAAPSAPHKTAALQSMHTAVTPAKHADAVTVAGAGTAVDMDPEMRKRIDAIKERMADRQKARETAQAKASRSASGALETK